MRRELVVVVLALGACKDKAAPAPTAGSAGSASAPVTSDAAAATGSGTEDLVVKGPAFDVPRIAPPATAVPIDPVNRIVVQIDEQGAMTVTRFVEPATDRIVKPLASVEELDPVITDLIVNAPQGVKKPAPVDLRQGQPPRKLKVGDLGPPTDDRPRAVPADAAARAPVAESTPSMGEDTPLVLASPKAPATTIASALVAVGGGLGVLLDGKLSVLRAFMKRGTAGTSTAATWVEVHVRVDALHVVALPSGKVERVPWDKDSVDAKSLLAAIDRMQAERGEQRLTVDLLVDPTAMVRSQQLVDVIAALVAGNVDTAIGVAPGAPDQRAAQIKAASKVAKPPGAGSEVSKEEIRRSIHQARRAQTRCYEAELQKDPTLQGKVTVSFMIGGDGRVTAATATGMTPAMNACIAKVFKQLRFARPSGGGPVKVNYPLTFRAAP